MSQHKQTQPLRRHTQDAGANAASAEKRRRRRGRVASSRTALPRREAAARAYPLDFAPPAGAFFCRGTIKGIASFLNPKMTI